MLELRIIPNICSEYSEHYLSHYLRIIAKSTYPITLELF